MCNKSSPFLYEVLVSFNKLAILILTSCIVVNLILLHLMMNRLSYCLDAPLLPMVVKNQERMHLWGLLGMWMPLLRLIMYLLWHLRGWLKLWILRLDWLSTKHKLLRFKLKLLRLKLELQRLRHKVCHLLLMVVHLSSLRS